MKNEKIYSILLKEEIEFVNKIKDPKTKEVKGLKISTKKGKIFKVGRGFIDMYIVSLVVDKHTGRANSWSIIPKQKEITENKKPRRKKRNK